MPITTTKKELFIALLCGIAGLLFFHLDHLVVTYSGWSDPAWLLHLIVDGSYVVVYGFVAWVAMRGWKRWRSTMGNNFDE